MDPVYAGSIAGLVLLFTGVLCCAIVYGYMEYRTSEAEYESLES